MCDNGGGRSENFGEAVLEIEIADTLGHLGTDVSAQRVIELLKRYFPNNPCLLVERGALGVVRANTITDILFDCFHGNTIPPMS